MINLLSKLQGKYVSFYTLGHQYKGNMKYRHDENFSEVYSWIYSGNFITAKATVPEIFSKNRSFYAMAKEPSRRDYTVSFFIDKKGDSRVQISG